MHNVLIVTPKLTSIGGVSSYWSAILPELKKIKEAIIHNFEIGGNGYNLFGPILDQLRFRKIIKEDLDLVILNPSLGFKSFFRDLLFAKQLFHNKIPFVVFFRGWDINFEKKVTKNYKGLFLKYFGKSKCIIVLSQDFEAKIREWGFKGRIIIETTTVDQNLLKNYSFQKVESNIKRNQYVRILFLSRLLKDKGIYETIYAFRELNKKYKNVELIIAGGGKEYKKLMRLVENDKNIILTGFVEGEDKIDVLSRSHIYCLPSYSEGLPNSVLEAMSFGLPIITTKVGGLKDFFKNEKMGFFVEPKDSNQILKKLEYLVCNQNRLIEIASFNYQYAKDNLMNGVVARRMFKNVISTNYD